MHMVRYRRNRTRMAFIRELMAEYALKRRPVDFDNHKAVVSIIGDYISDRIRVEGIYEREFLELLRDRVLNHADCSQKVALDVGANIGNHSLFLSNLFKRVIAFEPNPLARSILDLNLGLNEVANIEVRAVGLSDQEGITHLRFDPANLGAASASPFARSVGSSRREEIKLALGDEEIDPSEPVGFIKVDVEGAEEGVLKGLARTIQTHGPVIMMEQWADVIDAVSGTSPSFSLLRSLDYAAWEVVSPRRFRGRLGKLMTLILGHSETDLCPIDRLQKRDYLTLIFTPRSYVFPPPFRYDAGSIGRRGKGAPGA
jgi:FkbM family methyltransferase